ncbi:uncharacterized protein LOC131324110 isoform X5 [Rhododendron vialii]|uniref:uncharacterized protein LOC131324110 isoform X5 n=1 Tax=Rhododendron vialii TaxID=182163 RepID=UPI00265D7605|nr:uncharacterized protein LOC131324110 isoform X5 [Rhododendron vialii]
MEAKPIPNLFIIIILALTFTVTSTYSLPFVVFHGIADKCSGTEVTRFTELLSNWSGAEGYCIEIGNGVRDSWFMPLMKQTTIACEKVKNMSELSEGYNIVGLSQGNMVGRGVVEFCDGAPQVKNFISLAGPHAGIASLPFCGEHLAPANYLKVPTDIDGYMKGCKFLPELNNEHVNHTNTTYKERFASLENLVLIMFEQDKVLVPKETSLFGYYPDGTWSTVLPAQETKLYTEDWIGLKTLDEAGKVKFINVSGGHLHISTSDMLKYIVPYLEDDESSIQQPVTKSYHSWLSSIWNFIKELVGFTEDRILLYTSY